MDPDAQVRETAKGLLRSAQQLVSLGERVAHTVCFILPDGAVLETRPCIEDEAGKRWAYAKLSEMGRQLQATAAILIYDGVSSLLHPPGSLRTSDLLEEGETECLVVCVKIPGRESDWSCVAPFERRAGGVHFLPEQEFDFSVAPLLPDWYGAAGRA